MGFRFLFLKTLNFFLFTFPLIYLFLIDNFILENSDLDIAATEIFHLTNENMKLHHDLEISEQRCDHLEKQLKESQELKEIALAIVSILKFLSFVLFSF